MENIDAVKRLINSYKKLPGIGAKTAERLSYATLNMSSEEIEEFISSLENVLKSVHTCPSCGMKIDTPFCPICDDSSRDDSSLVVVSSSKAVFSLEKTEKYRGKYFLLKGLLSPIKGIKASDIGINELVQLVSSKNVKEVILACDSTIEGELTSQYIYKQLKDITKVTRLAYGLPFGADLEYVDGQTITRSFISRTEMKGE